MDTTTPTLSAENQQALLDRLLETAQEHKVAAERQGNGDLSLRFPDATVTVSIDHEQSLLIFHCESIEGEAADTLSTFMPLLAASGEEGATNAFEFAEMLALLLGATSAAGMANGAPTPEQ